MEARAKIEEDLFTRVPLSKTERRRAKATTRSMNSLANVGDFGDDVADLVEVAEELEGQRGKRQRLVDSVTLASGSEARKNQKPVSGEQDVPLRDSLGVRVPRFFSPASLVFFFFLRVFRSRLSFSEQTRARGRAAAASVRERIIRSVDDSSPWSLGVKNDARRTHSLAEVRRARRVAAAGVKKFSAPTRGDAAEHLVVRLLGSAEPSLTRAFDHLFPLSSLAFNEKTRYTTNRTAATSTSVA
jgi:hypothetical protein